MQNQSEPVKTTLYGLRAKEVSTDNFEALAKVTLDESTGNSTYWLKFATGGMDAGHVYNPQSPSFDLVSSRRYDSQTGRHRYEWRKVKKEVFDLYFRFLQTSNPVMVRQVERMI